MTLEETLGKVGNRLDSLADMVTKEASTKLDKLGAIAESVRKDIGTVYTTYQKRADALFDRAMGLHEVLADSMVANEYGKKIVQSVTDNMRQGKQAVVQAVTDSYHQMDEKLDELAKTRPELAGLIDGYVKSIIGSEANRRPRSKRYTTHAKYGEVIGYASSALLFLRGRLIVGSLPVLTRVGKYLHDKVKEAS